MSYSTSLPGLDEARLIAIETLLKNSVTNLNAALARDSLTPMTWTAAQITIGDTDYLDASRISIIGGGESDARDMDIEPYFAPVGDTSGYKQTLYTEILVYVHPDEFPGTDAVAQGRTRELALARVCDHIRKRVLNDPANVVITLTSREHSVSPDYDTLLQCYCSEFKKGMTPKSFGKFMQVLSASALHRGEIA